MKNIRQVCENVRTSLENNINQTVRINKSDTLKIQACQCNCTALTHLFLPLRFFTLAQDQQKDALVALKRLEQTQQQAVLAEWAIRCQYQTIRNPAGYLFRIIQKAREGTFRLSAAEQIEYVLDDHVQTKATTGQPPAPTINKAVGQQYIEQMKENIKRAKNR